MRRFFQSCDVLGENEMEIAHFDRSEVKNTSVLRGPAISVTIDIFEVIE